MTLPFISAPSHILANKSHSGELRRLGFQSYNIAQFNKYEAVTGAHYDALGQLVVTDLAKASKFFEPGAQIQHGGPGGQIFTLGKDGQWRSSDGLVLWQDRDGTFHTGRPA